MTEVMSTAMPCQAVQRGRNWSLHVPMSELSDQRMTLRSSEAIQAKSSESASATAENDDEKDTSPTHPLLSKQPPSPHAISFESSWIRSDDIVKMGNLPYLNGLRAVATIWVCVYHICKPDTRSTSFFGSFALTTHFVQGGFLITGALLSLQKANQGKGLLMQHRHVPQFFLSRWVRLYPALILMIIVTAIWWEDRHEKSRQLAKMIFRTLFKLQHTKILKVSDDPPNPFAHTWFLDVQEAFYLFWALVLPFIAMLGTKRRLLVIVVLFAFSMRIRLKENRFNANLPINLWKMVAGAALQLIPIPRSFVREYSHMIAIVSISFMVFFGSSIYLEEQLTDKYKRVTGDIAGAIITVSVTLAAFGARLSPPEVAASYSAPLNGDGWANYFDLAYIWAHMSPLSMLDSAWLSFVGRVSYSWYLWQVPIMHYEEAFMAGYKGIGSTAEAFMVSLCSTFWIEEPIRHLYQAHRRRLKQRAAAAQNTKQEMQK